MARRRSVLGVALLVVVACGIRPSLSSSTTSPATMAPSSVSSGPTSAVTTSATTNPPTSSRQAPVATTTVPLARPVLLVADDEGVRLEEGTSFVAGEAVAIAVPDLMGGVVYQRPQRDILGLRLDEELGRNVYVWAEGGPEPIWHVASEGASPAVLIDHPDAILRLVDVVELHGRPHVLYRQAIGGPGRESAAWVQVLEWLHLFDMSSGETQVLGLVGSWDSSSNETRLGGDLVAIAREEFGGGEGTAVGMVPVARLGEQVAHRWLPNVMLDDLIFGPRHECEEMDCRNLWAIATAAHDGSRLTWLEGVWSDGTSSLLLKSAERFETEEHLLSELGQVTHDSWNGLSLDDDGRWVVFGGGGLSTVTLVGPTGSSRIDQTVSSVRLWRDSIETHTELSPTDLGVALRDGGIGPVAFGTPRDDALQILGESLGPHSRSWDDFFHSYRWDWLGLTLSFDTESTYRADGVEHLVAWDHGEGLGGPLRTSGGVGVGDTYADTIDAHGVDVFEPVVVDECMPPWFVWLGDPTPGGLMVVLDSAPGPDARITFMHAGMSAGC